jgi:capsular polysaccharide biosynthesis protein
MAIQTMLLNAICRAEKMDNNLPPPEITATNVLDVVRLLREDSLRHAQLLDQLMACLQQTESPGLGWSPHVDSTTVTEPLLTHKIRRVEQHIGSQDPLARLKGTWIGSFYVNHLKQIPFMRWLVIWMWRTLYPFYVNHIAAHFAGKTAKRWRSLIHLGDYVKTRNIPTIKVLDAVRVETPVPQVFPAEDQEYLSSPHDHYDFPPIYVAEISNALVYGGTNLVFTQDAVICHDLYDFERDYTSEELHGRYLIDAKKKRMRLLRHDVAPERVPVAAVFVDACAPNYAHWLTEVLPRIAAFCAEEQFASIPIIVNDGLHHNIMESLYLIIGPEREIITLPVGRAIQADSLYMTSVAGYVSFERRDDQLLGHSHGLFSSSAFDLIRKRVFAFTDKLPPQNWPEKIYLRRNSGARKVTNASELDQILINRGYVIVEPEKLTFLQQAMLFSKAKEIVGSSGAALANLIFAPSNASVRILIGKYPNTSYWYWQNIACASGKVVSYILGEVAARDHSGIHADFTVNLQHVLQELGEKS